MRGNLQIGGQCWPGVKCLFWQTGICRDTKLCKPLRSTISTGWAVKVKICPSTH